MKISARNQFAGTLTAIDIGAVNAEVELTTAGGAKIVAVVTNDSVAELGLAVGVEATALVKASSVLVVTAGDPRQVSARNVLAGTISRVSTGPVVAEVSLALPGGGAVHATITHAAATALGLATGRAATALFKASAVILAVAA